MGAESRKPGRSKPPEREVRSDAMGTCSFRAPPARVSDGGPRAARTPGRVRADESGGRVPRPLPGGWSGRFALRPMGPGSGCAGGAPDSAEAVRPGEVRRWESYGPPTT
ncbi:hypothetical protein GCM10022207_25560 [Streptomyces lannensis]|uniref:Uncharacterized protein n=1 Tax=Streptomyces lannensis TaxID=766498 RepID=A0ABP7K003_9ACTN